MKRRPSCSQAVEVYIAGSAIWVLAEHGDKRELSGPGAVDGNRQHWIAWLKKVQAKTWGRVQVRSSSLAPQVNIRKTCCVREFNEDVSGSDFVAVNLCTSFISNKSFSAVRWEVIFRWKHFRKTGLGLPWWLSGKESACQCRRHRLDPWSQKIPYPLEQLSPWAQLLSLCSRAQKPKLLSP